MIPVRIIYRRRNTSKSNDTAASTDLAPALEAIRIRINSLAEAGDNAAVRIGLLEGMWQRDPDNPDVIRTPGSAYAMRGLSCLGLDSGIVGDGTGGGSGATVELLTDWAQRPEGRALAATLGLELKTTADKAATDAALATQHTARAFAAASGAHIARRRDAGLRRGIIPLNAERGYVYRNTGYALMRIGRGSRTVSVDLSRYFVATTGLTAALAVSGRLPGEPGVGGSGMVEAPAAQASMTREGAVVTVTLTDATADVSLLVAHTLQGRYVFMSKGGRIASSDYAEATIEPMLTRPTQQEIVRLWDLPASSVPPTGYELQRRRRFVRRGDLPSKGARFHKWVHPRLMPGKGVWRIRRISRRGYRSEWVCFTAMGNKKIKILG